MAWDAPPICCASTATLLCVHFLCFMLLLLLLFVDREWENFSYLELFCSWLAGKMFKQSKDVSQKLTFYTNGNKLEKYRRIIVIRFCVSSLQKQTKLRFKFQC